MSCPAASSWTAQTARLARDIHSREGSSEVPYLMNEHSFLRFREYACIPAPGFATASSSFSSNALESFKQERTVLALETLPLMTRVHGEGETCYQYYSLANRKIGCLGGRSCNRCELGGVRRNSPNQTCATNTLANRLTAERQEIIELISRQRVISHEQTTL